MKFGKWALATAVAITSLVASAARAGDQDFKLVNNTGVVIAKIMVSPHDEKSWGEDIMGRDVLSADEAVDIKFHRSEPAEYWDLKVVDKEGNEIVWQNLNLLKISKVTLEYKDSTPTAVVE